jgi:hypothetical protein
VAPTHSGESSCRCPAPQVEEKALADSVPAVRRSLEEFVYDFFLSRWGCRVVAEAHMAALIATVQQHAGSYRRMAMFLRLLGMPAPHSPPIPPSAVHTYTAILSRFVHQPSGGAVVTTLVLCGGQTPHKHG